MKLTIFLMKLFLVLFTIVAVPLAVLWCTIQFFLKDMWIDYWHNCLKAVLYGYWMGLRGMKPDELQRKMEWEELEELQKKVTDLRSKLYNQNGQPYDKN